MNIKDFTTEELREAILEVEKAIAGISIPSLKDFLRDLNIELQNRNNIISKS